ncbi:Conserved_hypothetical protein [Hexamita inflata]|uniref:Transmembrane protein n=1 Tax=Hexamita inflata TaxID=28002 RepID=A0ABP1GHC7_9EUKA
MLFQSILLYVQEQIALKSITNCYSSTTRITINKNDRTILANLMSTANSKCLVFPPDIAANLTISSAVFPDVLQLQVADFDYNTTDQLLFTIPPQNGLDYDLSLLTDEHFAALQIYSLSEMTQVEIKILDELKSDLTKCFSELSASFTQTGLAIHVCPSSACVQQMVLAATSPAAYIKQVVIKVNEFIFQVNLVDFITNYHLQICYDLQVPLLDSVQQQLISQSFIDSMFIIYSQQGTVQVQLKYDIYIDLTVLSSMFIRGEAFMYQRDEDTGYQILYDYEPTFYQQLLIDLQTLQYDFVQFRLTGRILKSQAQLTQGFSTFDPTMRQITFSCLDGSEPDQKRCQKMIFDDFNAFYVSPSYNLDMIFYLSDKIVLIMKDAMLAPRYTCWRYGVAVVSNTGLDLQLTRNNVCDQNTDIFPESYINTTFWIEILQNSVKVFSTERFDQLLNATNINKFRWNCSEIDCTLLYQDNITILLKYDEGGFTQQVQITKFEFPTFTIIEKTAVITGTILSVIFVLIVIILVFKVLKQIKLIRKQKHDKQKTN